MRSFPASTRITLPTALGAASLLAASAVSVVPAAADDPGRHRPGGAAAHGGRWDSPLGYVEGTHKPQTSDGVVGQIAPSVPLPLRSFVTTSTQASWFVAPGVKATVFNRQDARGPVREYLLAMKYRTPGLSIDTTTNGSVRSVGTVPSMVRRVHGIAGVNGDFYDIGDTGAPLGIDRNRRRGLLNGRLTGWNQAFYLTRDGTPEIGKLTVHSWVQERPGLTITNLNGPSVTPGGVGLYTSAFGDFTPRVVGGRRGQVRAVHVVDGRVLNNSTRLPASGPITGQLLIGRGKGAQALVSLRRGQAATIGSAIPERPTMAITGNHFLVDDGIIRSVDDREMAPRTAIGIDRDTHEILLLVVDGRQRFSRGFTMVEMADQMIDLGADEALNLDGGGSSTMVARHAGGLRVINSPSDGFLRHVADGLAITYTRPAARPGKPARNAGKRAGRQ